MTGQRLTFWVAGQPVGYSRGSARHGFTSREEATWRMLVAHAWAPCSSERFATYRGRVAVQLMFVGVWKQDADNLAKPVLDALTGLAWVDDRQVTDLAVSLVGTELTPKGGRRKPPDAPAGCTVIIDWLDL